MTLPAFTPTRAPASASTPCGSPVAPGAEPFASAEQAWFWTMAAFRARLDGTGGGTGGGAGPTRPCDPDDIVKCLDMLYRRRRIDLLHARILRIWGMRQRAPNHAWATERCDWRIWAEALDRLEWALRAKGIVAWSDDRKISFDTARPDGSHPAAGGWDAPAPPGAAGAGGGRGIGFDPAARFPRPPAQHGAGR